MEQINQKLGYKSLTECVMDYLKNQLIGGELKPGDEINFKVLCETIGVSRTPIREALIQLMKDGFIEVASRKGFRIKKLTKKEIEDLYDTGGLLEAEIMKSACDKMTEDDIKKLEDICGKIEIALGENNSQAYFEKNNEFNSFLRSFCGNQVILEFSSKVKERLYFSKKRLDFPDWERLLLSDHFKVIQYLKKRDKVALEHLLKNQHWSFSRHYPHILKFYRLSEGEGNAK